MQRTEPVVGALQGKSSAKLRLPSRSLQENNEVARHRQCDRAAHILLDERKRQVDARRYSGRGPNSSIAHKYGIRLDGYRWEPPR